MRALKALGPTACLLHYELKFFDTKHLSVTKAENDVTQAGSYVASHCFAILFLQAVVMLSGGAVCGENHNEVSQAGGSHVVSHCFGIHAGLLLQVEVL